MKKIFLLNVLMIGLLLSPLSASFYDAGTDFSNEQVSFNTKSETTQPLKMVNMLICTLQNTRADLMVNKGKYSVLLDSDKCEKVNQSKASKLFAIVETTRADNSSPQVVKVWGPNYDAGLFKIDVYLQAIIEKAPNNTNPIGKFSITYQTKFAGTDNNFSVGEVIGDEINGKANITYYQKEAGVINKVAITKGFDGSDGVVLTQGGYYIDANTYKYKTYVMTWDDNTAQNLVLQQDHNGTANSYSEFTGDSKKCFDRTKYTKRVYGYGLYDKSTGELYNIHSGFTIVAKNANDEDVYGYVGYWGTWIDAGLSISDLHDVKRIIDYSTNQKESITLTLVAGVLAETTDDSYKRINSLDNNLSLKDDADNSYNMPKDTMQLVDSSNIPVDENISLHLESNASRTFFFSTDENLTIPKREDGSIITFDEPASIEYELNASNIYESSITVDGINKNFGDIIYMNYGGRSDLWIPSKNSSNNYEPAFTFKDGTVLRVNGREYVTKALFGDLELQEASGGLTSCTSTGLNLNDTSSLSLPSGITNPQNNDPIPETPSSVSIINGIKVSN